MNIAKHLLIPSLLLTGCTLVAQAKQWTLQECLDYALANNIQLKQKMNTTKSSKEDLRQSKAALLPSVSFSTSQNLSYRPYSEQTITLESGTMSTSSDAVSYNGSYNLSARMTLWNGGRNLLSIKQNELTEQQNEYAEQQQANTIQEQIAKLYIQILYENEAISVSEQVLEASKMQLSRAMQMVEVGSLAKVDQVQLESQVAQDELNLVSAKSQLKNYKLQLKQLLEIHDEEDFDVTVPSISDESVLSIIPKKSDVYASALLNRPEVKSQQLAIESSDISIKSAKAGYQPTVSLSAGFGTSSVGSARDSFGSQIKSNMSGSLGLSVSVPVFDGFDTRTNIRKAKIQKENAQLQLQDTEKQLYSTIENYCLDATTSQQKFIYAKKNAESMHETYDLVSEQFRLGLKNIVELTTGKNNMLQAEQQLLETKYTSLLNQALIRFYQGENIKL